MTQEEFAKHCGLSPTTIQRVEAAEVRPRAKTFSGLDRGAGWEPGSTRALYETGKKPTLAAGPWTPMLTDEQIIAMDSHGLADHYIRTEREYGGAAAEDWLFHAIVVRRDARRAAGRTMAADGS
jgi:transcriptional regulator with XRE-family HTH domain